MTPTALFFALVAISLTGWVAWYALRRIERASEVQRTDPPSSFPKRTPLPPPSLAELADDMACIAPDVLADIFRRDNARLPH